jgi:putative oxidoreductase
MNLTIVPASWTPKLQAVLRIMAGLLFLEHGTGKFLHFPALHGLDQMPGGLLVFTGLMELIGGAMIVLGVFTRPVAFVLSGFMAAAYFMAHLPNSFFPALNNGEPAVLFCFVFLFLAAAGPGAWAIDQSDAAPSSEEEDRDQRDLAARPVASKRQKAA